VGLSAKELDVVFVLAFGASCLAARFFTAIFDSAPMPFCVVEKINLVQSRIQISYQRLNSFWQRVSAHRDAATSENALLKFKT
jgi:hypothetical protein